jgi:hypothetical protein
MKKITATFFIESPNWKELFPPKDRKIYTTTKHFKSVKK